MFGREGKSSSSGETVTGQMNPLPSLSRRGVNILISGNTTLIAPGQAIQSAGPGILLARVVVVLYCRIGSGLGSAEKPLHHVHGMAASTFGQGSFSGSRLVANTLSFDCACAISPIELALFVLRGRRRGEQRTANLFCKSRLVVTGEAFGLFGGLWLRNCGTGLRYRGNWIRRLNLINPIVNPPS